MRRRAFAKKRASSNNKPVLLNGDTTPISGQLGAFDLQLSIDTRASIVVLVDILAIGQRTNNLWREVIGYDNVTVYAPKKRAATTVSRFAYAQKTAIW